MDTTPLLRSASARPRRRTRRHLRLPEHRRHREWFPARSPSDARSALTWFVDRGVIHKEGADRTRDAAAGDEAASARDLARIRAVRSALREVALSLAGDEAPSPAALETVNRALHARQVIELVPGPDGVHVDHRHVGDPIDDALARLADPLVTRADRRSSRAHQVVRQRHLRLDLLRLVADEPAALVRHGDLRQPGQGRAPPRPREGEAGAGPDAASDGDAVSA